MTESSTAATTVVEGKTVDNEVVKDGCNIADFKDYCQGPTTDCVRRTDPQEEYQLRIHPVQGYTFSPELESVVYKKKSQKRNIRKRN